MISHHINLMATVAGNSYTVFIYDVFFIPAVVGFVSTID